MAVETSIEKGGRKILTHINN